MAALLPGVVLGHVAAAFHGHPSRQLTLVGVTGTNGKTTCATLLHRLLRERCGEEPVLIMSGGAAPRLAAITDLPFEMVDKLIFDGLLALQSHRLAL